MANFIKQSLEQRGLFKNYLVYGAYESGKATIIVEEGLTPQECKEYENYGIIIKEQVQILNENKFINLHIAQHKAIWLESLNELSKTVCELIRDFCKKGA